MRSESKVGRKKAEIAGVGSAQLEEWHRLVSSSREKMCDNLIFRLVLFSTANSRTGKNIAKKMDVLDKCEFRIGRPGPSIGKQSKNHLKKKSSSRREKSV